MASRSVVFEIATSSSASFIVFVWALLFPTVRVLILRKLNVAFQELRESFSKIEGPLVSAVLARELRLIEVENERRG